MLPLNCSTSTWDQQAVTAESLDEAGLQQLVPSIQPRTSEQQSQVESTPEDKAETRSIGGCSVTTERSRVLYCTYDESWPRVRCKVVEKASGEVGLEMYGASSRGEDPCKIAWVCEFKGTREELERRAVIGYRMEDVEVDEEGQPTRWLADDVSV